jgi:hypothetical protein
LLNSLEATCAAELGAGKVLLGEYAWQKIEVWALAGQDLPTNWRWQHVRSRCT